ncbi:lipopolysaccharide heptosyltransferase II [Phragmitibacter flavus]|uniref:lipopolysaccharide heptosyltransferase II n=1 Tax=Phragmitibacter flavus TaxID=2576071 RepID=A0A5R8KK02_9BACT|nr:lipopolysaccharide heptosyltransferase II [Phragmitibacter flavus]TLD72571.1 lipopolysaccharide heptosyltransferase II [Phragmitibacter flavus]
MASGKKGDSPLNTMMQFMIYGLFRMVELGLALVPMRLCHALGKGIGTLAWLFFGKYRRLAEANLRIAFGREQDQVWIQKMARRHFESIGANFLCGLKLPLMSSAKVRKRVTIEGYEHALAQAEAGRPLLVAVCHLSCWELLTQLPEVFKIKGRPAASVYQSLGNRFLNAHVKRRRESLGYTLFDRSEGFSGPMKLLREEKGTLGVLVDQHAGDKGVWCPFFDRLASTSSIAALMSIRCGTPIVPLGVYDDGPGRWKLVFFPPVDSREKKPTAEGITAALNLAVEKMVRRAPHNWFWVHNRWKTPRPDFLLTKYRRGMVYPVGYDPLHLQPFNLLVRSPNWLGDACMTFPAVRALKKGRPDLRLTIFCPAKLADLWQSLPEVDAVITKEGKQGIREVARRIRQSGPFDAAILFTNSTRSTLEFWWAGIPRLVGYRGSLRSKLLNQVAKEDKKATRPKHHADKYLDLAIQCGASREDAEMDIGSVPRGHFLGICAGAEYGQAKRWPAERFAAVATKISERVPNTEWLLFGAPGEKALGEQLSGLMSGVTHHNLIGTTNLKELVACLRQCRLLVTNDTGTMHLAAAMGVQTVSIFGSTEPVLTGPVGDHHVIVRHHVPCSPCFKRECPFGHYDCMTGVTVEMVEEAVAGAMKSGE